MNTNTNISSSNNSNTNIVYKKNQNPFEIKFVFQDSFSIPVNKEMSGQDLIYWGDNDLYGKFLHDLYLGSPIHAAILQGKVDYIMSLGLTSNKDPLKKFMQEVNPEGDTLEDVTRRIVFDNEVFGAFMLQIVWAKGSSARKPIIAAIYHLPVEKFRFNLTQDKIKYAKDWKPIGKPKTIEYDLFDLENPKGTQIFYYNGHSARNIYGTPSYEAAISDINSSRLISEYHQGLIRTGFASSLQVNFFDGSPTEDQKRQIIKDMNSRFKGPQGESTMVTFNEPDAKAPEIIPIQTSDNDKFLRLSDSVIQNIYSSHRVSTPSLFGLQTNSQKVGTTNEFEIGYEVFQKTYVQPRQRQLLSVLNKLLSINFKNADLAFIPMPPITAPLNDAKVLASCMYPSEMRKNLENWNLIDDANNKPEGEVYIGNRDNPNTVLDSLGAAKAADPNIIIPKWAGDPNTPAEAGEKPILLPNNTAAQ